MNSLRSAAVAAAALAVLAPLTVVTASASAQGSSATPKAAPTTAPTPVPTTAPTPVPTVTPTPVPTETAAPAPSNKWSPKSGVRFNEPRNPKKSHKINHYIRQAIINTPKGAQIRMVTWNYSSDLYTNDLIRAHRRGVSVRIIMANGLAESQSGAGPYARTRNALAKGNKRRTSDMTSWFRTCHNSCRGKEGIQHGKWFMFSKSGSAEQVVMSTSANLTDAAAEAQWNDLLTIVGRPVTWDNYTKVFKQMSRDKKVKPSFKTFDDGAYDGWFFPQVGKLANHNVMRILDRVRCSGARGDAGKNGRTVIRVSQAVFNGRPGTAIAGKLSRLKQRGCNIKLVYGVLNNNARDLLQNIPRKTILEDTDGDGFVDRYLHMKAMTISGNYDGKRSAHIVYQGSSNWSGMSTLSDEQGFVVTSRALEAKYSRFINYLFKNPPPQGQDLVKYIELRSARGEDPFALIREDMGMGNMQPAL